MKSKNVIGFTRKPLYSLYAGLERPTLRSSPLPVLLQVRVALRFLATGSFLITVGDTVRSVSKSTVSRVVKHFIHSVIWRLGWKIAFHRGEEARQVKGGFFRVAGKFYPSITQTAKESLDQDMTISQVPYTDLNSHINFFISRKWQERWSSCRDNKLFQIKPTLGEWPPGCRRSRKEEVDCHG